MSPPYTLLSFRQKHIDRLCMACIDICRHFLALQRVLNIVAPMSKETDSDTGSTASDVRWKLKGK